MKRCLLICALCLVAGCANVQPWERGSLAREDMQWQPDPRESKLRDHIHYSKEASSGGNGAAGGGCGCN